MSATAQCQNPLAVGASGSNTVTAKLCVCGGNPLQARCGDRSSPPAPIMPLTCGFDSVTPSAMSSLRSSNDGTSGSAS